MKKEYATDGQKVTKHKSKNQYKLWCEQLLVPSIILDVDEMNTYDVFC